MTRVKIGCVLSVYPEGFFLSVATDFLDETLECMEKLELSPWLRNLYRACSKKGISVIRFDADADKQDGFPTVDW